LGILSDRGRRVLECAFEFGASGLHTNQHGKSERRSRQVTTAQLVHHGSLREVEPPVYTWGFDQIPFWDNRSIFVRSKCGRLLQPGTYPVNGTIGFALIC
jgi:hypothetical protein